MIFSRMSGGKDVLVIEEVQPTSMDPEFKNRLKTFAQKQGISNGQLTREQFSTFFQERMAEMRAQGGFRGRGGAPGGSPGGPGSPPGSPSGDSSQSTAPGSPGGGNDDWVRESFRRRDQNNDNVLSQDEMGDSLRSDLGTWDKNRNGVIEFDEYAEYVRARAGSRGGDGSPGQGGWQGGGYETPAPVEEEKRPVVYRAGKLPEGLPTWFEPLDGDRDGQVGLYEWKKDGRNLRDFQALDGNGDGFITAEEALRYQKKQVAKAGGDSSSPGAGGSRFAGMMRSEGGEPGGPGGFGRSGRGGGPGGFGRSGGPGGDPNASAEGGRPGGFDRSGRGRGQGGFQRPGGFGGPGGFGRDQNASEGGGSSDSSGDRGQGRSGRRRGR